MCEKNLRRKTTVKVVLTAMLIALYFVLDRLLVFYPTESIKISFNFVPIAVAAVFLGPVYSMLTAGLGDLLGALLMPVGVPNPILTASAFLSGLVFGLFVYSKSECKLSKKIVLVIVANVVVSVVFNLLVNTFALAFMYSRETLWQYFFATLAPRLFKEVIIFVIRVGFFLALMLPNGKFSEYLKRTLN